MVTKGEKWGENKLGVGDEKMHPLYINTQHYIKNSLLTRTCYIAQGTLVNIP